MAAKKAKKPGVQSGQGYADRFKKSQDKAYTKSYNEWSSSSDPWIRDRYAGAKGMKQFAKDYKQGVAVGSDWGPSDTAQWIRRNTSGDLGASRTTGRGRAQYARSVAKAAANKKKKK